MVDAISARCFEDCEEKYLEVEEKGAVVDIPDVEAEFLFPRKGVAAVHLRPAGDSGTNLVAACLLGRIARKVSRGERARADESHLPGKDVKKLRQFVQGSCAQEPPEPRKPFGVRALAAAHRSELEHCKYSAVFACALLPEEDRTAVKGQNCDCYERGNRDPQRSGDNHGKRFNDSFHGTIIANYGIIYAQQGEFP